MKFQWYSWWKYWFVAIESTKASLFLWPLWLISMNSPSLIPAMYPTYVPSSCQEDLNVRLGVGIVVQQLKQLLGHPHLVSRVPGIECYLYLQSIFLFTYLWGSRWWLRDLSFWHQCGRPRSGFGCPDSAWAILGCFRHLGSQSRDGRCLFFWIDQLISCFALSLPFK